MNIPTIEELDKTGCEAAGYAAGYTTVTVNNTTHCRYLTAIRDAVVAACRPQLRPIAEMPAEVTEGCHRVYWNNQGLWYGLPALHEVTHFIDIVLPEPEYPADFEQAFKESGMDASNKAAAFKLWKGGAK